MTREEAERIIRNVRCHCDGRGVIPGPDGIVVKCSDCDGEFISYKRFKEAREVLALLGRSRSF